MNTVRVEGAVARRGPLTLGQADMLAWIFRDTESTNVFAVWPVPPECPLWTILGELLHRHESLRTTYRFGEPYEQLVHGEGELTVASYERHDPDELAASLAAQPFDLTREWPVRFAAVTEDGAPVQLVVVVSHVAVDMASLALLGTEFEELAAEKPLPAPAPVQPVDLAAIEASPAGRRRNASAAHHWEAALRATPQNLFAVPGVHTGASMQPLLMVRSRPAATALRQVVTRTRAGRSGIVLAAVCALVGHYVSQSRCLVTSVSASRFLPELARYVGPLSRDALIAVDGAVDTFDELVGRVHQRSMFAYARACDDTTLAPTIARVGHERGTWYGRDLDFNDHTGFGVDGYGTRVLPDPGDALTLTWLPGRVLASRLTVWVTRVDGFVELALWAEPTVLPTAEAELFGAGLVRLVEAAAHGPVRLAELGRLTGLEPVSRGPTWYRVDENWVDLVAVRQLVTDALGEETLSHVTLDADGTITCYVSATLTPQVVHERCMATLPGRPAAMAPHRYVVCAGVPNDRYDTGAWAALPVYAEGTGR